MNGLNELIQELCPDGVEYRRLGQICKLEKGNTAIQKAIPGEYPLVVTTSERKTNRTYQFNSPSVCVPLVSSRGHGVASLNQVYYQEGKFALGNILCGITPIDDEYVNAKYLFYYLNHNKDTLLVPLMRGGANVSLTVDSLERVQVPIPPLCIQHKIVSILELFEKYILELLKELSARRKQYEYYREKLLRDASNNPQMVRIGDLGKWTGGKTPPMAEPRFWRNGTIPWISSKDMKSPVLRDTEDHITQAAISEAGMNILPAGAVAIVTRSGILKHTFPVAYIPFETTVNQDIKALVHHDDVNPKYVAFALQGFGEDIRRKTKKLGGTVDSLDFDKIKDYEIPLPTMDIQNRIVGVLDNFEAICNDLNIGLPAEIEARTKQYEFYRDQLLTFAEFGKTLLTSGRADERTSGRADERTSGRADERTSGHGIV